MDKVEHEISSKEFWDEYISKLKPCLIGTWLSCGWKARHEWVRGGKLDLDHFLNKYGHLTVPVTDCSNFECRKMKLSEFINYLRRRRLGTDNEVLYLKDWHLAMKDDSFYTCPVHFSNDWLNQYTLSTSDSDYRFVYIGSIDTKTPLHQDVLASHSWSSNLGGKFGIFGTSRCPENSSGLTRRIRNF